MNETADLVHHVAGRLRLRLSFTKRNPGQLRAVQESLGALEGVRRVDANPTLGTVVVHYDPALFEGFAASLARYAVENNLFTLPCSESAPCISETDRSVKRVIGDMNRKMQTATGGLINLKELLPLAVAGYAFLFVDRAAAAAQWLSWLQFAFDTYIDLHEDEPVEALSERVEAMGSEIIDRHDAATEILRAEVAALRADLHQLLERLPR